MAKKHEIKNELGSPDSPRIILATMLIVAIEEDQPIVNTVSIINIPSLFASNLFAQRNYDQVVDRIIILNKGIETLEDYNSLHLN